MPARRGSSVGKRWAVNGGATAILARVREFAGFERQSFGGLFLHGVNDRPMAKTGKLFRVLLVALGLALAGVIASRWPLMAQVPATDYAWTFDLVSQMDGAPTCAPTVILTGLGFDAADQVIAGWWEKGCVAETQTGTGLKWSRRNAGVWDERNLIKNTHLRLIGRPPSLTLGPDGKPFYTFAEVGPFEHYYAYVVDLGIPPGDGSDPASKHRRYTLAPRTSTGADVGFATAVNNPGATTGDVDLLYGNNNGTGSLRFNGDYL